jgi:phospholipid transport system substrate-binding protein
MISRFTLGLALLAAPILTLAGRAEAAQPVATVQSLCDALVTAMKGGSAVSFDARTAALSPEVRGDFDLALMTRIVVGPPWRGYSATDRQDLVDAFSAYSVATYAGRFKSYSGERFEVDPTVSVLPSGDRVVHTKLFTGGPNPVQLDYMLRQTGDHWRIIDVFLSGTISELAARRSEYSTVLRQGGAPALVELLRKKAGELGH